MTVIRLERDARIRVFEVGTLAAKQLKVRDITHAAMGLRQLRQVCVQTFVVRNSMQRGNGGIVRFDERRQQERQCSVVRDNRSKEDDLNAPITRPTERSLQRTQAGIIPTHSDEDESAFAQKDAGWRVALLAGETLALIRTSLWRSSVRRFICSVLRGLYFSRELKFPQDLSTNRQAGP